MKEDMMDYYKRVPTEKQKREKNKQNNAENIDPGEKNEVPLHVETPAGEVIGTGKIIKTEKGLYWSFTTAAGTYLKKNQKVNLRIIIDRQHTDFIPTSYRHHLWTILGERWVADRERLALDRIMLKPCATGSSTILLKFPFINPRNDKRRNKRESLCVLCEILCGLRG